jgi:hypothetical protein
MSENNIFNKKRLTDFEKGMLEKEIYNNLTLFIQNNLTNLAINNPLLNSSIFGEVFIKVLLELTKEEMRTNYELYFELQKPIVKKEL